MWKSLTLWRKPPEAVNKGGQAVESNEDQTGKEARGHKAASDTYRSIPDRNCSRSCDRRASGDEMWIDVKEVRNK